MSLKRVIFLKILISEFSRIFWNLFGFFIEFLEDISLFKITKRGFYPQELRADVARDPRGCDMARKATW